MAENVTGNINDLISSLNGPVVVNTILALVLAYLITRLLTFALTRFSERAGKYRITVKMAIPLFKFTVYGVAFFYILKSIVALTSIQLVAFSGVLGAAVGFGLKDLLTEVVGGIIITLDKPYQVGDKVKIGEFYGEVKDIGLRATRLVTPDDNLVSAPNQIVLNNSVANANAGAPEMMVVVDLFIDASSDAETALKILREAMVTSRYVYVTDKRPITMLLKDYPFYRRVRAKGYVFDLRYEFNFESDVTRRAWEALKEAGISPPRPGVMELDRKIRDDAVN